MAGVHGGDIVFGVAVDTKGLNTGFKKVEQEANNLDKKISSSLGSGLGKSVSQVAKHTGKPINTIRSEVMKLAQTYRKQGMNMSSAMKKAYNEIGIYSNKTTSKAIKDAQDLYKSVYGKNPSKKTSGMNPSKVTAYREYGLESDPNKIFDLPSKKKSSFLSNLFGKNKTAVSNASKNISTEMSKAADNTTKAFKNSFSSINGMSAGLASKLTKLFSFAFLTRQLSRFMKSILDAGGYFEQMTQGMQILFADTRNGANATAEEVNHAYNKMYENAMHAYKDTGMSANEYMDTASSFATRISQETKGDTEAAADIIDTMMKDMSDNWHLLGGDFKMIQNAYNGLLRGNYRMFDNLKLGYGQTKAEVERLLADAEKLSGVHYDVNNLSDIIKAVHEIQENTGMTGTTAREAMTTWAGATNMLAKSWENFKSMVGQGLIWLLQPVLQVIGKIADALTAVAFKFMMWAKNIMGIKDLIVGRKSDKDYKAAATGIGAVNDSLGGTGGQAKAAKKAVKDLKKELLGFDRITKLSGESGTTSGGTGTSGSSGIGGGLPDDEEEEEQTWFDRQVQQAQDYISKIKIPEALQTALNHLKTSLGDLFDIVSTAGKWAWDNVLEPLGKWTINEVAPRVVEILASAIKVVNGVLETLGVILKPIWEHLLQPIAKALGDVFLVVLDAIKGALDYTAAALKVVKAVLEPLWEPLIKPMCDFIAKHVVTLLKDLKDAIEIVGKVLEWAAKKLEEFAKWIQTLPQKWEDFKKKVKDFALNIKIPTWDEIRKTLDSLLGKIWEKIRSGAAKIGIDLPTWSELKQKIADLKEKIYNKIRDGAAKLGIKLPTYSEFKDKIAQLKEKFKNAFKNISAGFSLKFSTAVGDLKSWINKNLIDKINSKFKTIPILRNHLIPRLAQGGFVKANTPTLAMIGDNKREGEIVAPESKLAAMAQMAASSSNDETNALLRQLISLVASMNLNVELDGEAIKNNTVRRINNHTRSTGQLEILI